MAYRKRPLDLPGPEDGAAGIKHPRSSAAGGGGGGGSPRLAVLEAGAVPTCGGGALPPIRSLAALALPAVGVPSFRHFHTASRISESPPMQMQPMHALPSPPAPSSGLTAGFAHLYAGARMPQPAAHPGFHHPMHLHPPPAHYAYAPPADRADQADCAGAGAGVAPARRASTPMSSARSGGSPHQQTSKQMDVDGGEALLKVARNWSRDETLSLVRAIKRHYEGLRRCKTNQERSNVWHRIHKEHSALFPGRSKKASQDRWGKVLSDYKDVVVHNKEKGAARWTFDFFKEVAAIVDADAQYVDSALQPLSAAAASDDLSSYSFGAASAAAANMAGPPGSGGPRPPIAHHRMSEPNLALAAAVARHDAASPYANQPNQRPNHQPQQQRPVALGRPTGASAAAAAAMHSSRAQPMPAFDPRYSPPRRTSYPQLRGLALPPPQQPQPRFYYHPPPQPVLPEAAAAAAAEAESHVPAPQMRVHSWAPSSSAAAGALAQQNQTLIQNPPAAATISSGCRPATGSPPTGADTHDARGRDPEETCRQVLDLLALQVRRIDAEQDNLLRLRESTQSAIARVEQIMQYYTQPRSESQ
ncbi:hypothetical protein EV174_001357 [Coemansia sp. RSA 2320]|nr:hypothetical protein EV174_001357 [Coemansia sp. RSA 2320]